MSKCKICGNELKGIETTNWFNGLCEKCWQEKHYVEYPFKKGISEKDRKIAELQKQLEEKDADIIALDTDNYSFKQQIDNLRQQLKSQPAEIVEKIRKEVEKEKDENDLAWVGFKKLDRILDTTLKEYQK